MQWGDPFGLSHRAPRNNWYDTPDDKQFRKWLERDKRDFGIPGGEHSDRRELWKKAADYIEENGNQLDKKTLEKWRKAAARAGQSIGLPAFAIGFLLIADEVAGELTDVRSPCYRFHKYLADAAKTGDCNSSVLKREGERCKERLADMAAEGHGSPGYLGVEEAFDHLLREAVAACDESARCKR